jgi:hypothetical protein
MAESKPAFLHIAGSSPVVEPSVRLLPAPHGADVR